MLKRVHRMPLRRGGRRHILSIVHTKIQNRNCRCFSHRKGNQNMRQIFVNHPELFFEKDCYSSKIFDLYFILLHKDIQNIKEVLNSFVYNIRARALL